MLTVMPLPAGGAGAAALERFYHDHFIFKSGFHRVFFCCQGREMGLPRCQLRQGCAHAHARRSPATPSSMALPRLHPCAPTLPPAPFRPATLAACRPMCS